MGYITLNSDVEIDLYDIIDNLSSFSQDELKHLVEETSFLIKDKENSTVLTPTTLDEEFKIKILNELFNKCTWEELQEIYKQKK